MTVTYQRVGHSDIEPLIGSILYLGDYDYYLEKKAEQEALREEMEQVDSDKPTPLTMTIKSKGNQKNNAGWPVA